MNGVASVSCFHVHYFIVNLTYAEHVTRVKKCLQIFMFFSSSFPQVEIQKYEVQLLISCHYFINGDVSFRYSLTSFLCVYYVSGFLHVETLFTVRKSRFL